MSPSIFFKKKSNPKHIAVIMDGNGRWAKKNGLSRKEGHRKGIETINELLSTVLEIKIPVISLYAFSTENWGRPRSEVKALFELLELYLKEKSDIFFQKKIRLIVSGDLTKIPKKGQILIADLIYRTKKFNSLTVNFCINYGSRNEILNAINLLMQDRRRDFFDKNNEKILRKKVSEKELQKYLYTKELPEVDLLIRTSGEKRLSNFLLYQSAYAELVFLNTLWPDFSKNDLYKALEEYQSRNRKYGAVHE